MVDSSSLVRAVDFSAFQGVTTPAVLDGLKSDNVELVIIQAYGGGPTGVGPNPNFGVNADMVLASGLALAAYSWPPAAAPAAMQNVAGRPIKFLGLDVEAGASLRDRIIPSGTRTINYCSPSSWQEIMGQTYDYVNEDFWLAQYPNDGRTWPTTLPTFPFGWVQGWQWAGTTTLHDQQFDLNVFNRAYIFPKEEATMDPTQAAMLAEIHSILTDPQPVGDGTTLPRWTWVLQRLEALYERPAFDTDTLLKAAGAKLGQ